ncbi:MAG TPA: hypothetical protein VKU41_22020 [Polyangiaceae bacterium]|nr:hypothetical protein [Polyangiaceae bacterium]
MTANPQGIEEIRRLARRAERRIRCSRALGVGAQALCAALLAAVVVLSLRKLGLLGEPAARAGLVVAAVSVVGSFAVGWMLRLPDRAGARALDRFHRLSDRLSSALAFSELPGPTPFMRAAIDDAVALAPTIRPALAVPIVVPRALAAAGALSGAVAAVALFEVRVHVPVVHARTIEPVDMAPDDLDDVKDFLHQIDLRDQSDDTRAAVAEFNKLVEDIANKRLDRTEAFRRMEALEERLLSGSEADHKALEQQLERVGEELKRSELTRPAGDALAEQKLSKAGDALHEIAKKVRDPGAAPDKAKLDQMREALQKAARQAEEHQQELEKRRQELADDILKMKQKMGDGGSDEERSLLDKKQRELDRLDRDVDRQGAAGRQLDRLDRELEQAAQDLMKDMGLSAQDLDQGAEDLNRMQQDQMTQQQKEELRQKLQELRELVRQQGQSGKGQTVRLRKFGRIARGQTAGPGQSGQGGEAQGAEGQGGEGQGSEGRQGEGQGGAGQQGRSSAQGGSQGGGGGETWILGPNGEKLLMLSAGRGGSEPGGGGGQGQGGGQRWGEGHDPKLQGGATNPKMGTQDTQVQGADTGQGGSRSQVILGAAERGFASHGYKKVYTEYHQVAEESLAKDEIPGGYRFYVKRYFELIRPREGQ